MTVMVLTSILLSDAVAQNPPAGGLERYRPGDRRLAPQTIQPRPAPPVFKLPELPIPPDRGPLSAAPIFILKSVEFDGNTVFTDEQLRSIAKPYLGRRVSTEDLQNLRNRLSRRYLNSGYINSGAVLPDQQVTAGSITYRIIEGQVTDIRVTGHENVHPDYIRMRLALSGGPPLNVQQLQEQVQILLQDPLIERVDVKLGPGTRLGEAELTVNVAEKPRHSVRATVSNSRPPSVGEFEGQTELEFRNLTGWGEAYRVTLSKTKGLEEAIGRIEIPVTAWDTKIYFEISNSDSEVVEQPFNTIDVEGKSRDYLVGITQPVYRTGSKTFSLALEFDRRRSETFLLGVPFSFSQGPINGRSDVAVFRFIQNWLDRGQDRVIAAQSIFSKGVDQFGATTNASDIPDGDFFAWLGQFQYVRRVYNDIQVLFRAEAQYTRDRLLPLEKYQVGGANSVRGYRENQLVRDKGYALSLEGRVPVAKLPVPNISLRADDGVIELAPFLDFGRAWDEEVENVGQTKLLSAGVGLRWRISDSVLATLYWAHPFLDQPTIADNAIQDDGLHFRITAGLF